MADMDQCVGVLRRRVGDTEVPFTFTDDLLGSYIADAVVQVEMDYHRGFKVSEDVDNSDPDNPIITHTFNQEPSDLDANLFAIKAHYIITLRTKSKADRENFLMRKGRLTLDNRGQSNDHYSTLKFLDSEYKLALMQIKNGAGEGSGGQLKGIRLE